MTTTTTSTTLEGTLSRFVWQKDGNGWGVAVVTDSTGADHKVAGGIAHCELGRSYQFIGKVEENRYGRTLKASSVVAVAPRGRDAVMAYLETLPGIGEVSARAIVNAYGPDEAIQKLETEDLESIKERCGIRLAADRLAELRMCIDAGRQGIELELQLRKLLGDLGTDKLVAKIMDLWGDACVARIESNPWSLAELPGIGFVRADAVAQRLGVDKESPHRMVAAVDYVVTALRDDGHTKHHVSQIIERATIALGFASGDRAKSLIVEGIFASIEGKNFIEIEGDYVQTSDDHRNEQEVADRLRARLAASPAAWPDGSVEQPGGLFPDQVAALQAMVSAGPGGTCLLTGAPGTGKTTMVRAFFQWFAPDRIALCAPTGKAAKRLSEQAGMSASTVHKLLETKMTNGQFSFSRDQSNPLDKDLVVVDEASMVDVRLFRDLLRAIPTSCYLLVVGDPNQLPSVSPGSVLRDLIESTKIPHAQLTQIKRTNPGLLLSSIHAVKDGAWRSVRNDPANDLFVIAAQADDDAVRTMVDLYLDRLPKMLDTISGGTGDPIQDIQMLVPWRSKAGMSAKVVNEAVQKRRVASGAVRMDKFSYGVGDKVIQTKNDYARNVVNGDMGVVADIELVEGDDANGNGARVWSYWIDFAGYERKVKVPCIGNDIDLAYAVTVHKSQGSEWPIIVLPAVGLHSPFYDRTLLYTAMSRAQKALVMVGGQGGLQRVVDRMTAERRRTNLQAMLNPK